MVKKRRSCAAGELPAYCTRPSATKNGAVVQRQPPLRRSTEHSPTTRPRQCWRTSVATRSFCSLHSFGAVGKPPGRESSVHAWHAYSPRGTIVSCARRLWKCSGAHIKWISMTDKLWAVALGCGALCCATVCSALSRVLSESDCQVDLSRRTRRERSMFASVCSVIVQIRTVAGKGDG